MKDIAFLSAPSPTVAISPDANDVRFDGGDVVMVEGHARKFQDIAKILLTRFGADSAFPTYGSQIPNVVGNRAIDVDALVSDGVVESIAFLAEVETSPRSDETIVAIRSLEVSSAGDPRQLNVKLDVALQDDAVVQSNMRL